MNKDLSLSRLIFIVVLVNVIGGLLTYFNLATYIIILGFRFQLSLCLPFFLVFRNNWFDFIKRVFLYPEYKKNLFFLFLILFPVLIVLAVLFVIKKIEIGDPEYFYEFGLSSIVDYPIYLIWNSFQLSLFFLFLIKIISLFKFKFLTAAAATIFLFSYFFIPFTGTFDYFQLASFILFALILGNLLKYFQNIYWLIIFSFSILWINIILFGSKSEMLINLIFASQYESWEGFLSSARKFSSYILPAQLLITVFILSIGIKTKRKVV